VRIDAYQDEDSCALIPTNSDYVTLWSNKGNHLKMQKPKMKMMMKNIKNPMKILNLKPKRVAFVLEILVDFWFGVTITFNNKKGGYT